MHYHLVLATQERRKLLTRKVLDRFEELAQERVAAWNGELHEVRAEPDYVHLHVELPPKVAVAEFINALKTGTSRRLRSEFPRLKSHDQLWDQSYCVIGGEHPPAEAIGEYLGRETSPVVTGPKPPARSPAAGLRGLSRAATRFLNEYPQHAELAIAAALEAAALQYQATADKPGNGKGSPAASEGGTQRPTAPDEQPGWMTVSEAAEHFGVSKPTIYNWINRGALTASKRNGRGLEIPIQQTAPRDKATPN
jgi:putative transposase